MNRRPLIVGAVLILLAIGFFLGMTGMAPRSNDPAAMMHTVGQVAGVVAGLGVALIVFGVFGKKRV